MANITAVLRTEKRKKDGTCPITFRFYHGRNYFFSSGQSVAEKFWDPDTRMVKGAHPLSANLNNLIQAKLNAANRYIIDCDASGTGINPDVIKMIISGLDPRSFFTYADQHLKMVEAVNYTTYIKEKSLRDKIFRLAGDITLDQITKPFLRGLQVKLSGIPNKASTVNKAINYMRDIYNMAVDDGAIHPSPYPFKKIQLREDQEDKERLSKEEILKLHDMRGSLRGGRKMACDMLLFAYYLFGMRFKNIYLFRKDNIRSGRIAYAMSKNKKLVHVPIHDRLQEILADYINLPGEYLFPIGQRDFHSEKEQYLSISSKNALYNKELKFLAIDAGIPKRIHFHMARHSFADNLRKSGADPVTAMNAMAHSKISTTQNYFAKLDQAGLDHVVKMIYGS